MAGSVGAARTLDPGPWTMPGVGCKGLLGGGNGRLSTFPNFFFNALIYFLSSLDRVSFWGKLRVY